MSTKQLVLPKVPQFEPIKFAFDPESDSSGEEEEDKNMKKYMNKVKSTIVGDIEKKQKKKIWMEKMRELDEKKDWRCCFRNSRTKARCAKPKEKGKLCRTHCYDKNSKERKKKKEEIIASIRILDLKEDIPDNHSVPLNEDKKPIPLSDDNALIPLNEDKAPVPLNDTEELTRRLKSLGCNGNNLDSEDEVDLEEEEVDVDTMDTQ